MRISLKLPVIFFKLPVILLKLSVLLLKLSVIFSKLSVIFFKLPLLFFKFPVIFFKFALQNVGIGSEELETPPGFPPLHSPCTTDPPTLFSGRLGQKARERRKCGDLGGFPLKKINFFRPSGGKDPR